MDCCENIDPCCLTASTVSFVRLAGSLPWKYSSDIYAVRKGGGRRGGKRVRIKQNLTILVSITSHPLLKLK